MVKQVQIKLEDRDYQRLIHFKKIVDAVLGKKTKRDDYIALVLSSGIEKLLIEAIGGEEEVLWETFFEIQKEQPEFFSRFLLEALFSGKDVPPKTKEKFRERLKYIG